MAKLNAYCKYCSKTVDGKVTSVVRLESGNFLYIGECNTCFYEIRRIVPRSKENDIIDSKIRKVL